MCDVPPPSPAPGSAYPSGMDERLEIFLALCRDIYERRMREGTWPWPGDSTNPDDVIESEFTNDGV